jgi:hypothetical protein
MIRAPYTKYQGKFFAVDGNVHEIAYLARFYKVETSWKDFIVFYGLTLTNNTPGIIRFGHIYISKKANLTQFEAQFKSPRKIVKSIFKKMIDRFLD